MAILGTKRFWIPAPSANQNQSENQILKNSGYINIQLVTANYMSKGSFWQNIFGGNDSVALTLSVKYQYGTRVIDATTIQDVRTIKSDKNYNLGINRNVAVKVPATADAISLEVKLTALKTDQLESKFKMLNKESYQAALQLAPPIVGQIITVSSLVKELLTESSPQTQLEASYAGIISNKSESKPVENGKLTKGHLILLSTNEGNSYDNVDESKFKLTGSALYYNNHPVENTYLVFNICFDDTRGQDETSLWFKKYKEALTNLDKILTTTGEAEIKNIYNETITIWTVANTLLDNDENYIDVEKIRIKTMFFDEIRNKYDELQTQANKPSLKFDANLFLQITGATAYQSVAYALPSTSSILSNNKFKPNTKLSIESISGLKIDSNLFNNLSSDAGNYKTILKKHNLL